MKKSAKQKYRLFALPMSPEIFAIVEKQRFSRVSSRYALVYTDRRAPKGAVPVEEKDCARLSVEDQAWLSDCNALLIAESIREKETEIAQGMSRRLDLLENALKEEKKNLKEG